VLSFRISCEEREGPSPPANGVKGLGFRLQLKEVKIGECNNAKKIGVRLLTRSHQVLLAVFLGFQGDIKEMGVKYSAGKRDGREL